MVSPCKNHIASAVHSNTREGAVFQWSCSGPP